MSEHGDFWRVISKKVQHRDRIISQVRNEYLNLDNEGRHAFREWVDSLVEVGAAPVNKIGATVSMQVHLEVRGANGQESVAVSPGTLAMAMASWDKGKVYLHKTAEF